MVACLAMVTGDDPSEIRSTVTVPTPIEQAEAYLSVRGVSHDPVLIFKEQIEMSQLIAGQEWFVKSRPFEERTMILIVDSPADTVDWHSVVVHENELYDPGGFWHSLDEIRNRACVWGIEIDMKD